MNKTIRLLLVEDDASAATIAQLAMEDAWNSRGFEVEIQHCANGLQAINHLTQTKTLPDLILTDVKMPLLDGLKLLELIKRTPQLRHIPVIILTTSDDPNDISHAFSGQCAGYILKDADFDRFNSHLEAVQRYWEASKLP